MHTCSYCQEDFSHKPVTDDCDPFRREFCSQTCFENAGEIS